MEIIETPAFTRKIVAVLSDEEYYQLQKTLVLDPQIGVLIPGTRGLRKLRWKGKGLGKSGGLRVIYYWYVPDEKLYMLLVFRKSEQSDLTPEQLKVLQRYVREGVL